MTSLNKQTIDITEFWEVYDEDGHQDCFDNLTNALHAASSFTKEETKWKLFKVLVSKVGLENNNENNPFRYSKERNITLSKLKKRWKRYREEDFCEEAYQKYLKEKWFEFECLEKEGPRRASWWMYTAISRETRMQGEEQKFKEEIRNLHGEKREKAIKERDKKNWWYNLYIG